MLAVLPRVALGLAIAILIAAAATEASAAALVSAASPLAAAGDYVPPVATKVTPYVGGRTLTWTAFDQLAGNGSSGPDFATNLAGVAGGSVGIVETGTDDVAHSAASWVSSDGGVSWTEHLVPGSRGFGPLAAHGGTFVTYGDGFWSSPDGAAWTAAASGPHAIQRATLAAGPQGFVAFIRNGTSPITRVWLSTSGTSDSWTAAPVQSAVSSFCANDIAVTRSQIVAIGYDCRAPSRPRTPGIGNGSHLDQRRGARGPARRRRVHACAVDQFRRRPLPRDRGQRPPDRHLGLVQHRRPDLAPRQLDAARRLLDGRHDRQDRPPRARLDCHRAP